MLFSFYAMLAPILTNALKHILIKIKINKKSSHAQNDLAKFIKINLRQWLDLVQKSNIACCRRKNSNIAIAWKNNKKRRKDKKGNKRGKIHTSDIMRAMSSY